MTDETTPPTSGDAPEPGSPEWLLAQLSGGRIDSRRERREAEAALEAAGVPIPDLTGEVPETPPAPPAETPAPPTDERPRARFSWETGTLEVVGGDQTTDAGAEVAPPQDVATPAEPSARSGEAPAPEAGSSSAIPFMWNLAPTNEPDPAVNPRAEIPEPSFNEPDFPFPSAAPLVLPKLSPRPLAEDEPALPVPPAPPAPPAAPEDPVAAEPAPAQPASAEPPQASETPEEPAAPAEDAGPRERSSLGAHAPLPPGTTAHEFDPFAQDLFAPIPATTPVPSVDEFTIPDEGSPTAASVPPPAPGSESASTEPEAAAPGTPEQPVELEQAADADHVTSDWSDIADMLGAHPETVDTAIVSPMPPVNEILPSFDAVLPRSLSQNPAEAETPPPARPASPPIEHSRERGPLNRWLLIAAAVLLAILIGVALFTLGRSLAAGRDQAPAAATHTSTPSPTVTSASPTPTPTPTATDDGALAGSGPLAPGQSYQWDKLRGGECINPFSSPWAQQFDVVDCTAQHAAQLVYTAPFASDPSAPFPGEQAIASQVGALCGKPGVVDLKAAAAYSDVQIVAAYPVNADQWSSGQRSYFCFVTRSSGQQFSSSIAGPGPTQ